MADQVKYRREMQQKFKIEEPHFDGNSPKYEKVTYPDGAVYVGQWYQSK